jgi:hypothetical protein
VSLEHITRHDIVAYWKTGLSERGHVVLAEEDDITVYRLHRQSYRRRLKIPRPEGMGDWCEKATDASGRVLLQAKYGSTTFIYNPAGKELKRREYDGLLLSVFREGEVAYREKINGKWGITVYRRQQIVRKCGITVYRSQEPVCLQLPAPREWEGDPSVCCLQDQYCVTEHHTHSLDIFSRTGEATRCCCLLCPHRNSLFYKYILDIGFSLFIVT